MADSHSEASSPVSEGLILDSREPECDALGKSKLTLSANGFSASDSQPPDDGTMCEPFRRFPMKSGSSISSAAATHARKTAMPGNGLGLSSRVSALSSSAFLMRFAHACFSERIPRTFAMTLPGLGGDSDFLLSRLVTLCSHSEYAPVVLALTISGTDCSCLVSLPTPCKRDWKGMSSKKWRDRMPSESRKRAEKPFATLPDAIGGPPHPEFVEAVMGFPIGWTDLKDSETPSSHKPPNGSDAESSSAV